jgi:hypothetical protein
MQTTERVALVGAPTRRRRAQECRKELLMGDAEEEEK